VKLVTPPPNEYEALQRLTILHDKIKIFIQELLSKRLWKSVLMRIGFYHNSGLLLLLLLTFATYSPWIFRWQLWKFSEI